MFLKLILLFLLNSICACPSWDLGVPRAQNKVANNNDRRRRQLIVSGDVTNVNEYPWQITFSGCGGALISQEWLITAAHCFDSSDEGGEVFYLQHGLYTRRSVAVYLHPEYREDDPSVKFDIALVQIEPVDCTITEISAVGLLDKGFNHKDCTSFLVGQGVLWDDGSSPTNFDWMEVISKIHAIDTCNRIFTENNQYTIDESQFCVFSPTDFSEDSCQGDSGTPLLIDTHSQNQTHRYVLSGVTSYGYGCGVTPGVYTFVPFFKDWILSVFPEAPFIASSECDKNHYNEGPDVSEDDSLPYTHSPVMNAEGYTSCEIVYASFPEYSQDCKDPNCKLCGPDRRSADSCIFCYDGYEVNLPNFIRGGTPNTHCAGKCVLSGGARTQILAFKQGLCKAHPCLSGDPFIYDPPPYRIGETSGSLPLEVMLVAGLVYLQIL